MYVNNHPFRTLISADTFPILRKTKSTTNFTPAYESQNSHVTKYSGTVVFENTKLVPIDLDGIQIFVKNPDMRWKEKYNVRYLRNNETGALKTVYLHSNEGHSRIELNDGVKVNRITVDLNNGLKARAMIDHLGFLLNIEIAYVKNNDETNDRSKKITWFPLSKTHEENDPKLQGLIYVLESHLNAFNNICLTRKQAEIV